tara:strand:+ start:1349 stop:2317 length:969 start_codon:yes stop_codon:yes gene_type:complete
MKGGYFVLLYYCYTNISNPNKFRENHHLFCINNNLKGRVIVSEEGINGTISGKKNDCENYMKKIYSDKRFENVEFKVSKHSKNVFNKLNVRLKNEIVNSGINNVDPNKLSGKYMEPQEFKTILKNKPKDVVILDIRSNYEYNVGKFKNAVTLDIENFREFQIKIDELKKYKNKKIITYCTGGVKCEKASGFLLKKGFKNVYQLHGGIIKYGIEEDGYDFDGKCYVFDDRLTVDINKSNPSIISKCYITGQPSERMVNCANPECNIHVPMSQNGARLFNGCCSKSCMKNEKTRDYNGSGNYQKSLNGYNPYIGYKNKLRKIKG